MPQPDRSVYVPPAQRALIQQVTATQLELYILELEKKCKDAQEELDNIEQFIAVKFQLREKEINIRMDNANKALFEANVQLESSKAIKQEAQALLDNVKQRQEELIQEKSKLDDQILALAIDRHSLKMNQEALDKEYKECETLSQTLKADAEALKLKLSDAQDKWNFTNQNLNNAMQDAHDAKKLKRECVILKSSLEEKMKLVEEVKTKIGRLWQTRG